MNIASSAILYYETKSLSLAKNNPEPDGLSCCASKLDSQDRERGTGNGERGTGNGEYEKISANFPFLTIYSLNRR